MQCEECSSKADKNWEFCPKCGNNLRQRSGDLFSEIFERFGQEFAGMNKAFERQVEAVDLSQFFERPKKFNGQGSGFSISIVASGNRPPKVSVKTFGGVDEKRIKQQVYQNLGEEQEMVREQKDQPRKVKAYETTEEPKTNVQKVGNKVVVDMELPGVKSASDIVRHVL